MLNDSVNQTTSSRCFLAVCNSGVFLCIRTSTNFANLWHIHTVLSSAHIVSGHSRKTF